MNLAVALLAFVLACVLILVGVTRLGAWLIELRYPPVGEFSEVDGARLHFVHVPPFALADLPPLVFIHGASSNLRDPMLAFRPRLQGRAHLLFVDRPGHGWSARGQGHDTPAGQAAAIAALIRARKLEPAIIIGHSFGASIAAALALEHPEVVRGLVFLAPASHPWPGGSTSWHSRLAARPVLGRLFSETVACTGARLLLSSATACVFAPNPVPENYIEHTAIRLIMRPHAFRANAIDVAGLYEHVAEMAPRYSTIAAPAVILSGTSDTVVYEEIHAAGLARDIPGSELVWVDNLGHKPDWIVPELAIAAIEKVAGLPHDLAAMAEEAGRRLAARRLDPMADCTDEQPELSPTAGG